MSREVFEAEKIGSPYCWPLITSWWVYWCSANIKLFCQKVATICWYILHGCNYQAALHPAKKLNFARQCFEVSWMRAQMKKKTSVHLSRSYMKNLPVWYLQFVDVPLMGVIWTSGGEMDTAGKSGFSFSALSIPVSPPLDHITPIDGNME